MYRALTLQEVDIGREGAQQVQNVVSSIIAYDTLAFDAGTKFHSVPVGADHRVRHYLQLLTSFA